MVHVDGLPLTPRAVLEQLVVGLSALIDALARKIASQWKQLTTNLLDPYPLLYLLRLHAPERDLLLLSALLLAGAPPEDAFQGNLWRRGEREGERRIVNGPKSWGSRSHRRVDDCRKGSAVVRGMEEEG